MNESLINYRYEKGFELKMSNWEIVLLETSDIHGNVLPINYGTNHQAELGLAKIATLIKETQAAHKHVITIDNGDVIQGTPLTYHYAKFEADLDNPMIELLNQLHYDLAVIGNHEFNYGLPLLNKAVQSSHFPWLAANILNAETKEPFFGQPYYIRQIENGPKIGVLGLTTKYIPNWEKKEHIANLVFEDVVETAQKWVKFLKVDQKVDIIVVSYHGGFEKDLQTGEATEVLTGENQGYALCYEVPGIDVLLTGHQHRDIAGQTINDVLVMQPGSNGQKLGKVTLQVAQEADGFVMTQKTSELLSPVGVKADEDILKTIQPYEKSTQAWLDQPIGHIEGDMTVKDPMQIRLKDNPLVEFINKVQMDATNVDVSFTALFDNQAPGFPKDVTMRSVVSNYIYPNTLVVLKVSGAVVKAALERSASYFELQKDGTVDVNKAFLEPKPQHFNYDMWEGIEYELDIRQPLGERVTFINYHGQPLKSDQTIEVVMNNYRAGGGGDYMMFQDCEIVQEIQIDVSELIANYILKHKTIETSVDHNWRVVY